MSELYCEKFDDSDPVHCRVGWDISRWTKRSNYILSASSGDLKEHPYGVLVRRPALYSVVGYGAIKELTQEGEVGQLGTLIASPFCPEERNIAKTCLQHIIEYAPTVLPDMKAVFAYGNYRSTPIFEKLGGVVIGEREQLAATGCNNVIDLTETMGLPGLEDASLTDILKANETRVK